MGEDLESAGLVFVRYGGGRGRLVEFLVRGFGRKVMIVSLREKGKIKGGVVLWVGD